KSGSRQWHNGYRLQPGFAKIDQLGLDGLVGQVMRLMRQKCVSEALPQPAHHLHPRNQVGWKVARTICLVYTVAQEGHHVSLEVQMAGRSRVPNPGADLRL